MSDYTKTKNFTSADANEDAILGTDFDTEFDALEVAVATKPDIINPAVTTDEFVIAEWGLLNWKPSGIGLNSMIHTSKVNGKMNYNILYDATAAGNITGSVNADWNYRSRYQATLIGNVTFTFTSGTGNFNIGISGFEMELTQDGTGGRTVTWPSEVKWPGGVVPTLGAAGSTDLFRLRHNGTSSGTVWYGEHVGNYS